MLSFTRWLRRPVRSFRPTPRTRLSVEPLEDRLAPATLTRLSFGGSWSASASGYWVSPPYTHPYSESQSGSIGGEVEISNGSMNSGIVLASAGIAAPAGGPQLLSASAGTAVGDLRPLVSDQSWNLSTDFETTAVYTITSTEELPGTPVRVTIRAVSLSAGQDRDDVTFFAPSFSVGSGAFTLAEPDRTVTVNSRVGELLTIRLSGGTVQSVTGTAPVHYTTSDISLYLSSIVVGRLPDLAINASSGLTQSADGRGVQYSYWVEGTVPPEGTPVDFYWATGEGKNDILPGVPPALTTTLGRLNGTIDWSVFGTPPPDATHLVMILDPNNEIIESDEDNNVSSIRIPVVGRVTGVTAAHDEPGPADVFGTYLSGVSLDNSFAVTTEGVFVASIRVRVPGLNLDETRPLAAAGPTHFAFDPSRLSVGDHAVTVTALDVTGTALGDPFVGTIRVIDRVAFTLEVEVPGTGRVPASDLRLVADIAAAPALRFFATASGVPLPDVYLPRMAVWFDDLADAAGPVDFVPASFDGGTATFLRSVTAFGNTVADQSAFDWGMYLGPRTAYKLTADPARVGESESARVFIVARPYWLRTATATYSSAGHIAAALGEGTLGYAFKLQVAEVNVTLPKPTGLLADLFGDLDSSLTSGLDVYLFARLTADSPDDTEFAVGDWRMRVKFLGDSIFDKTLSPGQLNVRVDGRLQDPRTLSGIRSLTVSTLSPVDLLQLLKNANIDTRIDWAFGGSTDPKKKWQITGRYGAVSATLSLSGSLYAELKELAASGALTFAIDKQGAFSLDKKASWVQLNVDASARLNVVVTGTVGVNLIVTSVNFVAANLRGIVDVAFAGQFRVTLDKPTMLDKANSYAGLRLAAMFEYAVGVLPSGKPDYKPFMDEPFVFGPFRLFHLQFPHDSWWEDQ